MAFIVYVPQNDKNHYWITDAASPAWPTEEP